MGDLLKYYRGGGDYGICKRCKRTNTTVVTEMPAGTKPAVVGWSKVSTT